MGVFVQVRKLEKEFKILERKVENCELRNKQLIILLSEILKSKHRSPVRVTTKQIIDHMERLINLHCEETTEIKDVNLLDELLDKEIENKKE
jgi:hypothetical protein